MFIRSAGMEERIKSLDLRSKMTAGTLMGSGGIVPLLAQAHAQREEETKARLISAQVVEAPGGGTEWGDLLDQFFVACKQLDDVHAELTSGFALAIPTPKQVPLPSTEHFTIPQLMSTNVAPEDAAKIKITPNGSNSAELREAIAKQNANMEASIARFNSKLDVWRKTGRKGGVKRPRDPVS